MVVVVVVVCMVQAINLQYAALLLYIKNVTHAMQVTDIKKYYVIPITIKNQTEAEIKGALTLTGINSCAFMCTVRTDCKNTLPRTILPRITPGPEKSCSWTLLGCLKPGLG